MTCDRIISDLDDYLDGHLSTEIRWELEAHCRYCEPCQTTLKNARQVQKTLSTYPVSGPSSGFFDRALAAARANDSHATTRARWSRGRAGKLAAAIAVVVVGGLLLQEPEISGDPAVSSAVAGISMALFETRTVNLVFASSNEMADVSLTVDLPDGVELAGYSGRGQVSWTTRLQVGRNVLPLELVATGGDGGELTARLRHDSDEKIFTVSVAVI